MACDCFDKMNKAAEPLNVEMIGTYYWSQGEAAGYYTPTIATQKLAPRKKGGGRFALKYCPFCGTRYVPEAVAEEKEIAA